MSFIAEVQELIDDVGVLYIPGHVYNAVNEAAMDAWGELWHQTTTATVTVTGNQEFLDIPTSIMIPRRIRSNNTEWYPVDEHDMERYDEGWRSNSQGQPKFFIRWDAETLKLYPKSNGTYAYIIEGQGYPDFEVSATSTDFTSIKPLRQAVKFLAGAVLAENIRPDLAQAWRAEATDAMLQTKKRFRKSFDYGGPKFKPGGRESMKQTGAVRLTKNYTGYLPG